MLWWNLRRLRAPEHDVRKRAIQQLGRSRHPKALQALVNCVASNTWERDDAAEALAGMGDIGINALIALLDFTEYGPVAAAARALGRLRGPRIVDALLDALGVQFAATEAAQALGELGELSAVTPLIEVIRDQNSWCRDVLGAGSPREEAAQALKKIADTHGLDVQEMIVRALTNALQEVDENTRAGAAMALGVMEDVQAVPPLIAALADPNTRVVLQTVEALGAIGDRRAVDALTPLLESADDIGGIVFVSEHAATALGRIKDPTSVGPLIAALRPSRYYTVVNAIIGALGEIGRPEAVEALIPYLGDEVHGEGVLEETKAAAARALGDIADERAREPLAKVFLKAKNSDLDLADEAALALGKLRDASAVDHLIDYLERNLDDKFPETIVRAAQALAGLGKAATKATPVLKRALQHAHADVHAAAAAALDKIATL